MPICHDKKVIFIHVPRTGGSSIEKYLDIPRTVPNFCCNIMNTSIYYKNCRYAMTHVPAQVMRKFFPEHYEKYYKFAFVRNPYERVVSEYFWLMKKDENQGKQIDPGSVEKFSKWLFKYYTVAPKDLFGFRDHHCTQKHLLCDEGGKLMVDDVFRYENYNDGVQKIKTVLNISKAEIPWVNFSKYGIDKKIMLTDENKEFIYKIHQEDFLTFGYDK